MAELAQVEVSEETASSGAAVGGETPESGAHESMAPEVAQLRMARPRARRPVSHVPVSVFGAVPVRCSSWGIKQVTLSGQWEPLSFGDGRVNHQEWPLSELSEENVRARWGDGRYRVMWYESTPGGGRKFMCMGRIVDFASPELAAPPAPAPAASSAPDSLGPLTEALKVLAVIRGAADEKIDGMVKLAQVIGGGQRERAGVSGEDLLRILREERQASGESTQAAIAAAVEPLRRQIAEMTEEDDGEAAGGLAAAASAAAPLIRGRGALATALNFASQNPELVKTALPIVAGAFSALASLFVQSQTAAAEQAAAKQAAAPARPRAEPRPTPAPEPEPAAPRAPGDFLADAVLADAQQRGAAA